VTTLAGLRVLPLDIRTPEGRDRTLVTVDHADIMIEGLRPGVMERLGLGPGAMLERNPRLVYERITGWGQTGRWRRSQATPSITSRSPALWRRSARAAIRPRST
jgi:crotonobetainyl-CoA:carnitine CoA-transferase CaiB-like acyl-CoA transferase